MNVRITRVREQVALPTYATKGSIAFDMCAAISITVPPRGMAAIPTGLIIATPKGYGLFLAPRSSLFKKKGLRLANTIGIIDQDYRGPEDEIHLLVWNPNETDVSVQAQERLAQGFFAPVARVTWDEGPLICDASRGSSGSTGGYVQTTV